MQPLPYLSGYQSEIQQQVQTLLSQGKLADVLLKRHPEIHSVRSDKALYDYTIAIKNQYLRKSQPLSKVIFDDKISLKHQALGLHSYVARKQGTKIKAKNEIRISSRLKKVPEGLLRMVVVHELEFELRLLLTLIDADQNPYR